MSFPALYEIRVEGHLPARCSKWFEGMRIANLESGQAALTGELVDQAALHGVLARVRDLGLTLMSVNRIEAEADGDNARA